MKKRNNAGTWLAKVQNTQINGLTYAECVAYNDKQYAETKGEYEAKWYTVEVEMMQRIARENNIETNSRSLPMLHGIIAVKLTH